MVSGLWVDIVVATNRNSPYLAEALESVNAQTYQEWRLFVVDDGAPDPEALDRCVERAVKGAMVLHQLNAGPSAARNRGVAAGTAPLVTFLDDDDVWSPDRLEKLVRAIELSKDSIGAHSGAWYMNAAGARIGRKSPPVGLPEEMISGSIPLPFFVTVMVRRDALQRAGGFDPAFRWGEDNDLILRLLRFATFSVVDEDLVGYRRHSDNATNAPWHLMKSNYERMLRKQISEVAQTGDERTEALLKQHYRRFVCERARETPGVVRTRLKDGYVSRAALDLAWALRRAPFTTIRAITDAAERRFRSS